MVVMTERDNLHGIATDCPQRASAWAGSTTRRYASRSALQLRRGRLFPKIVRDIVDEQEDGPSLHAPFVYGHRRRDPVCSSFSGRRPDELSALRDRALLEEAYPPWRLE
jgi:hypothetical protein